MAPPGKTRTKPPTSSSPAQTSELTDIGTEYAQATWVQLTYITPGHRGARRRESYERVPGGLREAHRRVQGATKARTMSPESARAIELLKFGLAAPAPDDPAKRTEIAEIETRMTSMYGAGKYCPKGPGKLPEHRRHLEDARHQPRLGQAARGLDWLAFDRAADAQGLPALRRARERRRARPRLQGPRRPLACRLRHEPGRVRVRDRAPVDAGEAAL